MRYQDFPLHYKRCSKFQAEEVCGSLEPTEAVTRASYEAFPGQNQIDEESLSFQERDEEVLVGSHIDLDWSHMHVRQHAYIHSHDDPRFHSHDGLG